MIMWAGGISTALLSSVVEPQKTAFAILKITITPHPNMEATVLVTTERC